MSMPRPRGSWNRPRRTLPNSQRPPSRRRRSGCFRRSKRRNRRPKPSSPMPRRRPRRSTRRPRTNGRPPRRIARLPRASSSRLARQGRPRGRCTRRRRRKLAAVVVAEAETRARELRAEADQELEAARVKHAQASESLQRAHAQAGGDRAREPRACGIRGSGGPSPSCRGGCNGASVGEPGKPPPSERPLRPICARLRPRNPRRSSSWSVHGRRRRRPGWRHETGVEQRPRPSQPKRGTTWPLRSSNLPRTINRRREPRQRRFTAFCCPCPGLHSANGRQGRANAKEWQQAGPQVATPSFGQGQAGRRRGVRAHPGRPGQAPQGRHGERERQRRGHGHPRALADRRPARSARAICSRWSRNTPARPPSRSTGS